MNARCAAAHDRIPAMEVYERLFGHWGPQGWWPGDTPLEVAVGAILTQNTAWSNVVRAIDNLKAARMLSLRALAGMPAERLAGLIVPAGYYNLKARRLLNFIDMLVEQYGGVLDRLFRLEDAELRSALLAVKGIGPETADSIMLYAAGRPVFVVDAYTRRFMLRHGWLRGDETYDAIAEIFTGQLQQDLRIFNEFHALIVRLGKEHCRRKAECSGCPLNVYSVIEENHS
jgi:endonuclease III related protein